MFGNQHVADTFPNVGYAKLGRDKGSDSAPLKFTVISNKGSRTKTETDVNLKDTVKLLSAENESLLH